MVTVDQFRTAILDVLAGKVAKPAGIQFDSRDELRIGVQKLLENDGLLPPLHPSVSYVTFEESDERQFRKAYDDMIAGGVIIPALEGPRFSTELLPVPFSINWQFVKQLGPSGQSTTRQVRRLCGGSMGVLKIPRLETETERTRFLREVEILDSIHHPNVVTLMDRNVDEAKGALGYVTPLGTPLNIYWDSLRGNLTPKERYDRAYEILRQLCDGLVPFHSRQHVHRDLKPENIIIIAELPIIIDFGVAIRPSDERVSLVEGRPVANRDTTPPAAQYGLHENIPAWDCYSLSCIYGYLLGTSPKPKQFHWRFHPLAEEERSSRARAVLAACSHEDTVPRDASAFIALLDSYRLHGRPVSTMTSDDEPIRKAEKKFLENQALREKRNAEEREAVDAAAQMIEPILDEVRIALQERCVGTAVLPITQYAFNPVSFAAPISPRQPIRGIIRQVYSQYASAPTGPKSPVCFFNCTCGTQPMQFKIAAYLYYSESHIQDSLRFAFNMWCRKGDGRGEDWANAVYWIRKDGTITDSESGNNVSPTDVANRARHWALYEEFWNRIA